MIKLFQIEQFIMLYYNTKEFKILLYSKALKKLYIQILSKNNI